MGCQDCIRDAVVVLELPSVLSQIRTMLSPIYLCIVLSLGVTDKVECFRRHVRVSRLMPRTTDTLLLPAGKWSNNDKSPAKMFCM